MVDALLLLLQENLEHSSLKGNFENAGPLLASYKELLRARLLSFSGEALRGSRAQGHLLHELQEVAG